MGRLYFMANTYNKSNKKTVKNYKTIDIDYSLRPKYYDDFKCTAQNCKFTCCTGWRITMNRKDYLTMKDQHGSEQLNQQIKQGLHKIKNGQGENLYAEILCNKNNHCPLFTEDGLCRLQMECGYEILPTICKTFPRNKSYEYSGYEEHDLNISCEAVLELLWNLPEGVDFVLGELPKHRQKVIELAPSSPYLYFQEIRSLCIDLLQDRRFSMGQRILLMGIFLQKLPLDAVGAEKWCIETKAIIESQDIVEISANLMQTTDETVKKYLLQNLQTFLHPNMISQNEVLQAYQKKILDKLLVNIQKSEQGYTTICGNTALYKKYKENFYKNFGDTEYFFENIMVAVFFSCKFPDLSSKENLWKGYVSFCNIYSLIRFVSIISCEEDVSNPKDMLFEAILFIARTVLHDKNTIKELNDLFFKNESSSLAYMMILLSE